jgi:murein DD-endopeptidase MepM/ murein hydrolase activator NlpD
MHTRRFLSAVTVLVMLSGAADSARSESLNLIFPTSNRALLDGDGPAFYQYTDRNFRGVKSRPWEGGQYGFVRNLKETAAGIVHTRFHEGVDIKPVYRNFDDEPLDTVRAIDGGVVVYINSYEGYSSYGKYVVVEHWWSGSPFYSLYAHLNSINVRRGQKVRQGDRLGRLGYTGPGLNKRRAHLHFEINMMLNEHFDTWFDRNYRATNRHHLFNGVNLAGIDVAQLYLSLHRNPSLSIDDFITQQEPFFKMAVPNEGLPDLIRRYAWLMDKNSFYGTGGRVRSWEIAFTESGVPIRIEPSDRPVLQPIVTTIRRSDVPYAFLTGGLVSGSREQFSLGSSGKRFASLLLLGSDEQTVAQFEISDAIEASYTDFEEPAERLRTW